MRGQIHEVPDRSSRQFDPRSGLRWYEVGRCDGDLQEHLLMVVHQHGARAWKSRRTGDHCKATAKQRMGGIGDLYFWEVVRDWVLEGGIKTSRSFDRVNHDKLMSEVEKRIKDKRVLALIRRYLKAGLLAEGLVVRVDEGTPQGGPLSPLLSNLLLDQLDRELERRGHRFVRYADDANIYVKSERAGRRVMASVSRFLTRKLRLRSTEQRAPWPGPGSGSFWASPLLPGRGRSGGSRRKRSSGSRRAFARRPTAPGGLAWSG